MKRDEARAYFAGKGLSYDNISLLSIRKLSNMVESELIDYYQSGGEHAMQMNMRVSNQKKKDTNFKGGNLVAARIGIDGSYFKDREGITFSQTGFIGFGGEFSDVNVQPILQAFCKWCDTLDY